MREKILELLDKKGDLPPLPDILVKVQQTSNDPKSSVTDLAGIIEMEPVLSGRIMSVANSAFYTRGAGAVKTLPMAIGKLGLKEIEKIVFSLELSRLFTDNTVIDSYQFWRHSLAVGVFAQSISPRLCSSVEDAETAYLTGLVHDIGIMVFSYLVPEEYSDFLKKVIEKNDPLEIQEKSVFGIDHAELGFHFIRRWWNLEKKTALGVKFHHSPDAGKKEISGDYRLINVSNCIINNQGFTNGIFCYFEAVDEKQWQDLGISPEEIQDVLGLVDSAVNQASTMLK